MGSTSPMGRGNFEGERASSVQKQLNQSRCHISGPKEACIRWDPDSPCEGAIIRGEDMPRHARRHFAISCAKMAEPIDLPFALWTRVGQRKHKFNRIYQVATTDGSRRIRINHQSAAAMQPCVKLLWPLVMAALWNRAGHYSFALLFLSSFYLFSFLG